MSFNFYQTGTTVTIQLNPYLGPPPHLLQQENQGEEKNDRTTNTLNRRPRVIQLFSEDARFNDSKMFPNVINTAKKVNTTLAWWTGGIFGGVTLGMSGILLVTFPPVGALAMTASLTSVAAGTATATAIGYFASVGTEMAVDYLFNLSEFRWFRDRHSNIEECIGLLKLIVGSPDQKKKFIKFIDSTPEMQQFFTIVLLEAIGVPSELSTDAKYGVKYDKDAVEQHIKKYIENKSGKAPKEKVLSGNSLYFEIVTRVLGTAQDQIDDKPPEDSFVNEAIETLFKGVQEAIPKELLESECYLARKIRNTPRPITGIDENFLSKLVCGKDMKQLTRLIDFSVTLHPNRYWPECPPPLDWIKKTKEATTDLYVRHELELLYESMETFFETDQPKTFASDIEDRLMALRAPHCSLDHVFIPASTGIERYNHSFHEAISPYLGALFCKLAYLPEEEQDDLIPEGWSRYMSANSTNGHYGVAFKCGNVVVISHRGSDFNLFQNIVTDVKIARANFQVNYSVLSNACIYAVAFSNNVRSALSEHDHGLRIVETGHSLGGFHAELNAYIFNDKAITYDSPGTKTLLLNAEFRACLKADAYKKAKIPFDSIPDKLSEENYTSFVSSPNIVNTLGGHIGRNVYRLYPRHVPQDGLTTDDIKAANRNLPTLNPIQISLYLLTKPIELGVELWIQREGLSHSLDQIAKCFDPISGEPYLQRRVLSWPTTGDYLGQFFSKDSGNYLFTRVFDDMIKANHAYEVLIQNIPGYATGNFTLPLMGHIQDTAPFKGNMLERFDLFYSGDRFKKTLLKTSNS